MLKMSRIAVVFVLCGVLSVHGGFRKQGLSLLRIEINVYYNFKQPTIQSPASMAIQSASWRLSTTT